MIIIAYGQLWLLLAIWLAVVGCAFGLGWSGGRYTRPEPAPQGCPRSCSLAAAKVSTCRAW